MKNINKLIENGMVFGIFLFILWVIGNTAIGTYQDSRQQNNVMATSTDDSTFLLIDGKNLDPNKYVRTFTLKIVDNHECKFKSISTTTEEVDCTK